MSPRWLQIVGFVLHLLIAALFLFAGGMKLLPNPPAEMVTQMTNQGLGDKMRLIGAGEVITAVLLVVPVTSSLGLLLVSGLWGGIISHQMSHHEDFLFPSFMLALTWAAGYFRDPRALASFLPGSVPDARK